MYKCALLRVGVARTHDPDTLVGYNYYMVLYINGEEVQRRWIYDCWLPENDDDLIEENHRAEEIYLRNILSVKKQADITPHPLLYIMKY